MEQTISMHSLEERLVRLESEVADIRATDRIQDKTLADIKEDTTEMLDIFRSAKGSFKVIGWIGKGICWIGGIASALYAFYYALINWPHRLG